ncbi:MAG: selenide, water dikinase SelD [bacterium]|nr:selenide, water dikinase SelD [bacterium]
MGGGHAHVQVLRRWAMKRPRDIRLAIVLDRPVAIYSGMVPGFVAGDYAHHALEIDIVPLARRAGAGVILAAATGLDPIRREISIEGRPPLRYDVVSLDIGSTVRGLDLPGVDRHALATRPIARFVGDLDQRVQELASLERPPRVIVVGGGAAGAEIAFTLDARLRGAGLVPQITLLSSDDEFPRGASDRTRRLLAREAFARGIELRLREGVIRVDARGVVAHASPAPEGPRATSIAESSQEVRHEADLVLWATGAAPGSFAHRSDTRHLATDEAGFIEVRDTLQAIGFDDVFAAGDCARLVNARWIPRAGVYAVRQGPILDENLRAYLSGRSMRRYRPQRDFLALLNLGNRRALGAKWGHALAGGAVYRLKDRIDRRFMSRFQVLDEEGLPREALESLGGMAEPGGGTGGGEAPEMPCGGCAAKLGALPLSAALAQLPAAKADPSVVLGLDARDDVAATRDESGKITLHNVDVIRSFCDDPWLVGRVAASNALSDLYAKGGRPQHAQAIIGLPDLPQKAAQELLFQTLSGLRATLDGLGVSLLGGHTTIGDELTVGLSVSGEGPGESVLLTQAGAAPGDDLLLTQALGTGVVLAADMQGRAAGEWVLATHEAMQRTNAIGGRIALDARVHAATDVTGFGFAGHLLTLLDSRGLVAEIERDSVPHLPGARRLWAAGLRSTAHPANRDAFRGRVDAAASESDEAWLFDPQTAGGLLLAVAPDETSRIVEAFAREGEPSIVRVGQIREAGSDMPGGQIDLVD